MAKLDLDKLVKEWKDGERTLTSVIDTLIEHEYSVAAISRVVDRPYRQVYNTSRRRDYNKRPSERGK